MSVSRQPQLGMTRGINRRWFDRRGDREDAAEPTGVDATALEGTPFAGRVAHGYFILSKAAGLFVEPRKGPVLLNYGLDECRFTKPVYPGATIGVRLTVKEKINQEQKSESDIPKGIVKWLVDVYDETGETVALATILTMVRRADFSPPHKKQ